MLSLIGQRVALAGHGVDMIQMRNLNVDPELYKKVVGETNHGPGIGLIAMMHRLRAKFEKLKFGYFNPPHQTWDHEPGPPVVKIRAS